MPAALVRSTFYAFLLVFFVVAVLPMVIIVEFVVMNLSNCTKQR